MVALAELPGVTAARQGDVQTAEAIRPRRSLGTVRNSADREIADAVVPARDPRPFRGRPTSISKRGPIRAAYSSRHSAAGRWSPGRRDRRQGDFIFGKRFRRHTGRRRFKFPCGQARSVQNVRRWATSRRTCSPTGPRTPACPTTRPPRSHATDDERQSASVSGRGEPAVRETSGEVLTGRVGRRPVPSAPWQTAHHARYMPAPVSGYGRRRRL